MCFSTIHINTWLQLQLDLIRSYIPLVCAASTFIKETDCMSAQVMSAVRCFSVI